MLTLQEWKRWTAMKERTSSRNIIVHMHTVCSFEEQISTIIYFVFFY